MNLSLTVDHINDGPAPFDVTATATDGTEARLRFPDGHPGLAAGDKVSVSFEQKHFPADTDD